jgi:hypothetical protein
MLFSNLEIQFLFMFFSLYIYNSNVRRKFFEIGRRQPELTGDELLQDGQQAYEKSLRRDFINEIKADRINMIVPEGKRNIGGNSSYIVDDVGFGKSDSNKKSRH